MKTTVFPRLAFSIYLGLSAINSGHAQTTLSGDHIITGNLNVGVTGTSGNLTVAGQRGNGAGPSISVVGDGGVVFTGSYGIGSIPSAGAGPKLIWYPKKAAFLVGAPPTYDQIGDYSVAGGLGSYASGVASVAFGDSSVAEGDLFYGNRRNRV